MAETVVERPIAKSVSGTGVDGSECRCRYSRANLFSTSLLRLSTIRLTNLVYCSVVSKSELALWRPAGAGVPLKRSGRGVF